MVKEVEKPIFKGEKIIEVEKIVYRDYPPNPITQPIVQEQSNHATSSSISFMPVKGKNKVFDYPQNSMSVSSVGWIIEED